MHIVRDASALSAAMTANASYSAGDDDAQKNLTLEFSRRARGIPVWAVLRTLGRRGLEALVDNGVRLAQRAATGLRDSGLTVDNRVVLNQVLVRASTPQETVSLRERVLESGHAWVGQAVSAGEPAIRISVSSWRTKDSDIDALVALISTAHSDLSPSDIL
jgi:glutamate/tyrosine decarboxylase-like PLP-dependent enzyme